MELNKRSYKFAELIASQLISVFTVNSISCGFLFRLLTGVTITDIDSAKVAIEKLHNMGAKTVVISSSDLGSDEILIGLASTTTGKKYTSLDTGTLR